MFVGYSAIVYTSGTENESGMAISDDAKLGKLLFQEKNCISCHQIYGLGGYMGPDLTNVIQDPGKGPDYAKAFLISGTDKMPDFDLSDEEIEQLIAFLEFMGADGVYPPKNVRFTWYGTIEETEEDE